MGTELRFSVTEHFSAPIVWGLIIVFLLVQNIGCNESASAVAKPRSSSKTIVTADSDGFDQEGVEAASNVSGLTRLQRRDRTLDMSFLHEDHFAVTLIDVVQIYQNPDLQGFQWSRFTKLLQPYVGRKNADPGKLSAVWILCDREIADADKAEEAKESDFVVFVVEFLEPYDKKVLAKTIENREQSESHRADSQWRSKIVTRSDRQIAIGTTVMLEKLSTGKGNGVVATAISKIAPDVDVALSLTFEPVRGALQGVMAMATQFLGEDMKALLQLPTSARQFEATLSLTSDRLLGTELEMSSSDSAEQVTEVWSKLLDSGNIGQLLTLFSYQYGSQKRMFKFRSLPMLKKISRQIEASGLYKVRSDGPMIKSEFTRPRDFGSFLKTAVDDVERTLDLRGRMKRMEEVAEALQNYEGIHGHLPASNFQPIESTELPDFSWRCELLPLLGWQRIYDKIDFQLPWDSEVNTRSHRFILPALHDRRDLQPMTPMLPLNVNWMFPDRSTHAELSSITDRREHTAIALEVRVDKTFHYFQPRDLTSDDLSLCGRNDELGVIFIDGNFDVRVMAKTEENLKAVLSIAGGERLSKSDFIEVLGFSN